MKFKDIVDSPCGLRHCFDSLELQSGYARRCLLEQEMMTSEAQVESCYSRLQRVLDTIIPDRAMTSNIQFKLQGLRDISSSLSSLESGYVLDDIALFEIKHLAMLARETARMLPQLYVEWDGIDLDAVVAVLDPDGLGIGTFYIYDSYSPVLRDLRKALEKRPDDENLLSAAEKEEEVVRGRLCGNLRPYALSLGRVMKSLASLDITIAKALQMREWGMTIPFVGAGDSENLTSQETMNIGEVSFTGLFNPQVREILSFSGRTFQSIDFEYSRGIPTTIIGANMGGKTVALKTLCLCQYLMQFGFAVPASEARMIVFDCIRFCIGDEQSESRGLSSFASEMLRINAVIEDVKKGMKVLALIDEPARTTNPVEGQALVCSLLELLSHSAALALILTTHYKVSNPGRCWRVKGLIEESSGIKMDYALVPTSDNEVPREALTIARRFGVDPEWTDGAARILQEGESH